MRNHIQDYLAMCEHDANQSVMSATGERTFGADGFIDGDLYFTDDLNPGNFYPADGDAASQAAAPMAAAAPVSQPYIVTVSNASANTVSGFEFWGAAIYAFNSGFNAGGSLTINGVTITSNMQSPISYRFMLQQSLTNNFTVGRTYLASISGSQQQVIQPLRIVTYDANGNSSTKTLPSPLPPSQFQPGVYENRMPYRIDGFTTMAIDILPSVVFQLYWYPSFTINLARGLGDKPIGRGFGAPKINQPNTAVLMNK
jgi:hypothetical protein